MIIAPAPQGRSSRWTKRCARTYATVPVPIKPATKGWRFRAKWRFPGQPGQCGGLPSRRDLYLNQGFWAKHECTGSAWLGRPDRGEDARLRIAEDVVGVGDPALGKRAYRIQATKAGKSPRFPLNLSR